MEPAPPSVPPPASISPTAPAVVAVSPSTAPGGEKDPNRIRDRRLGLVIVAASFAACLALSIWAKEKSRPETSKPPGPPTIEGIAGYPNAIEPVDTLVAARKLTRRPILRGITIDGVQNDGTIDVSEGPGRARYTFQSEAGHGAQPDREPGTLPKRITCGKQDVVLRKEGLVADPDQSDYPCPPGGVEALPEPQCSARMLWKMARRRKVPNESRAHIEYFRSKAGPAWRFEVLGTAHRFTMYGDCKRELSGAEAMPAP